MELDLRLNRLTDEGGRMLLEGLADHHSLTTLNLSSNMVGSETAAALAEIISDPSTSLCAIDLSSNILKEADGDALSQGLARNSMIVAMDLRQNDIPVEAECLV